jgi:hypothetical protein
MGAFGFESAASTESATDTLDIKEKNLDTGLSLDFLGSPGVVLYNICEDGKAGSRTGITGRMFINARDHALFYVAAKTSARLRPPLPDVSLPAVCHSVEIYTPLKETLSFVCQQLLSLYATNSTDLICFCDGSINSSLGREGSLTRVCWFLPQIVGNLGAIELHIRAYKM